VQEELEHRDAVIGVHALEGVDFVVRPLPFLVGAEALDALDQGRTLPAEASSRAEALLQRQIAADQSSATMLAGLTTPRQPPADVLITIAPAIQQLISAASKR
jgi:hypothetical protein